MAEFWVEATYNKDLFYADGNVYLGIYTPASNANIESFYVDLYLWQGDDTTGRPSSPQFRVFSKNDYRDYGGTANVYKKVNWNVTNYLKQFSNFTKPISQPGGATFAGQIYVSDNNTQYFWVQGVYGKTGSEQIDSIKTDVTGVKTLVSSGYGIYQDQPINAGGQWNDLKYIQGSLPDTVYMTENGALDFTFLAKDLYAIRVNGVGRVASFYSIDTTPTESDEYFVTIRFTKAILENLYNDTSGNYLIEIGYDTNFTVSDSIRVITTCSKSKGYSIRYFSQEGGLTTMPLTGALNYQFKSMVNKYKVDNLDTVSDPFTIEIDPEVAGTVRFAQEGQESYTLNTGLIYDNLWMRDLMLSPLAWLVGTDGTEIPIDIEKQAIQQNEMRQLRNEQIRFKVATPYTSKNLLL